MQGTRVMLARHAETAAPNRFHGAESDIGLSELGARQAELLGGVPQQFRSVRSLQLGDAQGCRHGEAHRRRLQAGSTVDRRSFTNGGSGLLSGLSREEGWAVYAASKTRWIDGDLDHTHEGGESFNDVRKSRCACIAEAREQHAG